MGLCLSTLSWAGMEEATPGYPSFPKNLPGWVGVNLSLGYNLITLSICSRRTLHIWHWFCSGGNLLCPPNSWFKCYWTTQLPAILASLSGQMWLGDTLHSDWGCDSAPGLDMGKLDSRAVKTSSFEVLNQGNLHPAKLSGHIVPQTLFSK